MRGTTTPSNGKKERIETSMILSNGPHFLDHGEYPQRTTEEHNRHKAAFKVDLGGSRWI